MGTVKDMPQEIMSLAEAAEFLIVHSETLRHKAKQGKVPAAKIGRSWRFLRSELVAWLQHGGELAQDDEDRLLVAAAEAAYYDPENQERIPWEQAKAELAL